MTHSTRWHRCLFVGIWDKNTYNDDKIQHFNTLFTQNTFLSHHISIMQSRWKKFSKGKYELESCPSFWLIVSFIHLLTYSVLWTKKIFPYDIYILNVARDHRRISLLFIAPTMWWKNCCVSSNSASYVCCHSVCMINKFVHQDHVMSMQKILILVLVFN